METEHKLSICNARKLREENRNWTYQTPWPFKNVVSVALMPWQNKQNPAHPRDKRNGGNLSEEWLDSCFESHHTAQPSPSHAIKCQPLSRKVYSSLANNNNTCVLFWLCVAINITAISLSEKNFFKTIHSWQIEKLMILTFVDHLGVTFQNLIFSSSPGYSAP